MSKNIQTDRAPAAIGAYSQAVEKNNVLFVSGQLPLNPETKEMAATIEEQTRQSLTNIEAILSASDLSLSDVVKNTIYVTTMDQATAVNEVYAQFFGETKPARAMVGVKELPKNAMIEIASVAMRG